MQSFALRILEQQRFKTVSESGQFNLCLVPVDWPYAVRTPAGPRRYTYVRLALLTCRR